MEYQFPEDVSFACEKCAQCCGDTEDTIRHVLLLKSEAERISKKTGKEICEFAIEVSGFEPYIYEIKKPETVGKCCFLVNSKCTIYEARPIICRFYPFELINLGDENYLFSFTTKCPGIGKGSNLERAFFEKLFCIVSDAMNQDSRT